jgi:uncharacterized protein YabE (DUF348 family)
MAGMGNHGRHRHRASTGFSPEATASGDPSTGSADDWFEAGYPPNRPEWQVDDVDRAAEDAYGDYRYQGRSAGDRWYPGQSAVDGPGAADRQGGLGWDHTLGGRGALGGLGSEEAGSTGEHPVPMPRSGAESTGQHAVWEPESRWPSAAGEEEWPQVARVEPEWPPAAHAEPEPPQAGPWAPAPEWFAPEQEEPAPPAPAAWAPRRYRVFDRAPQPEHTVSEPYRQPTQPEPGNPWQGDAESTNAGFWPGQPDGSDWPTETHSAVHTETRRGDAAVGEYEQFGAPEPERPPLPGRIKVRSSVRHPLKLAIYGVVLAGLIGGTAAWASMDKSVTISVDGEARSVHTYAGSVRGVLNDNNITVGQHDILAPAADAPVKDGTEIVLRRGRLLRLNVDGVDRQVWVTAVSVDEALNQVGYRQNGLYLSASRSKRLPLDGFSLTIRTPKSVTVAVDGHTLRMVSTAATVGDLLGNAKVRIGANDRVSQLSNALLRDGMAITITRVRYQKQVVRTVLKYKVIEKKDPTKDEGTKTVQTTGVDGLQEVTYMVTYLNGKATTKKIVSSRTLTRVVNQVVLVGTKPAPADTGSGGAGSIPSSGGLNWAGLAQCESGGNPKAYNPSGPYYGLYQFDVGTWQANGGSGIPSDASAAEQTRVAQNLYNARGASPWPVCGKYL